jgi:excisionase family DNA binding protein
MTPALFYTPAEVAQALKVPVRTIYPMIRAGRILAARVGASGRVYRIPARELDRLVTPAASLRAVRRIA